jgi:hypothetical protein
MHYYTTYYRYLSDLRSKEIECSAHHEQAAIGHCRCLVLTRSIHHAHMVCYRCRDTYVCMYGCMYVCMYVCTYFIIATYGDDLFLLFWLWSERRLHPISIMLLCCVVLCGVVVVLLCCAVLCRVVLCFVVRSPIFSDVIIRSVGLKIENYHHCNLDNSGIKFAVVIGIIKTAELIIGSLLALSTRKVSTQYNETTPLSWSIYDGK